MFPLKLSPAFIEKPWGGRSLERLFGKPLPTGKKIGESWEVSDRPEGPSVVAGGPLAGRSLAQLAAEKPREILGPGAKAGARFPLLVKFIDASERLSLQVHPGERTAAAFGAEAKTECWVVVSAAPDASLHLGLSDGKAPGDLETALASGDPERILRKIPVSSGDAVFVPAGTVHAIGPGIVLAEIQQSSDSTYRLWDWGRSGAGGKRRPLHRKEGLASIVHDPRAGKAKPGPARAVEGGTARSLIGCEAFSLERLDLASASTLGAGSSFACLGALSGGGAVRSAGGEVRFKSGDWILVPHACGEIRVEPESSCRILVARPA